MKKSTTIEEQIKILIDRGMNLDLGEEKVKEVLEDIGYFRLGFYCFPFEISYPNTKERNHKYTQDAKISNVIKLYYLDDELRNILLKYINRIEINFRTKIIYEVSNKYKDSNTWFVDPAVMEKEFIDYFNRKIYTENFKKHNKIIKLHHKKYNDDKYAPAWKTLEFMTFGSIFEMFKKIKDETIKEKIAKKYDINSLKTFENYIRGIIEIRNKCAHGGVLFDHTLSCSLANGPALKIDKLNKNKLYSVLKVIIFVLCKISVDASKGMERELVTLFKNNKEDIAIRKIIEDCTGYKFN